MADTEVQSVRGKGWVTFDENNETEQSTSANTSPRKSSQSDITATAAETSPGSLEVWS